MKFLAPGWLWLLIALPFLLAFLFRDERRRQARFERFAARAVWRTLVPEMDPSARLRKAIIWLAAVGFAILALARPQWGSHEESIKATGLDIMIALDVSNSMETEDVIPSRLKKGRHLVKSLVERLKGDRIGIVAFAGSSYVACPLTTDSDYVTELLQIIGPRMIATQGTDVGIGLDTARKALDRGAEEVYTQGGAPGSGGGDAAVPGGDSAALPQASRVVILISDGEDQEEGALSAAKALRDGGAKLYVIGIGTEKGGPVPVRDESGSLVTYKKNRKGEPVVSTFRPDALMKVAAAADGRYWNASTGEAEIDEMLQDMGALSRTDYAERKYLVFEDRFQYPLALAVLLLLIEISVPVRNLRAGRKAKGASSAKDAKPGATAAMLGLVWLTGALLAPSARAEGFLDRQVPLEAYLENEKGLKALKQQKPDEAERRFGTAQALDPDLPELQFNQGVIQMQKEDHEAAARDFADAAKGAAERGDAKLEAQSLYNLGGALSKKKDIQGAVRSYLGAIESAQRSKDPALEEDARRNLQLLIHERQKQKQQEKQDQNKEQKDQKGEGKQDQDKQDKGGSKDQKNQKDKKDGKDQKDQKDDPKDQGQSGKDQAKNYEDTAKSRMRQFKSPKLTKEDAERVMAELADREKNLQARIKKQGGSPQQQNHDKDW